MSEKAHEGLVSSGVLSPVAEGGADERLWLDCDLASLAENRLLDATDPHELDAARRADWIARATSEAPRRHPSSSHERAYWILEEQERIGTVAVATATLGGGTLRIASFYVFPQHRHRGAGRRALERIQEILARHRLGLRLETCWTWQRTVRFYVRAGLWVYMWKRDLSFFSAPRTPRPFIEVGDREAELSVQHKGKLVVLARAMRRGDVLELDEPCNAMERVNGLGEAPWLATSTLALSLALAGFPLVRSQQEWEDSRHGDGGPPEALAYKIGIWEAWARSRGWHVETPRIPGLSYPTWAELEAGWAAENAAFEAELRRTGGVIVRRDE